MHSAATISPQPHRACGACGASGNTICHHQRFIVPDGYPLPTEYNVAVCHRCGFFYVDPAATQRDYDRFYCEWSKYDDSATATGSGLSPYDAARLAITASNIARALPSRASSILDAGCATGGLFTALCDQGFTAVAGLDPSTRCASVCRDRGFEAYVGSIASAPAHMPKFDCIVFSHVLEHVYEAANNHLGDLQQGLKIVSNYVQVVRFNNVRAAFKLQVRDVDSFIHQDFRHRDDIRYIKKTLDTRLQLEDFANLVQAIREATLSETLGSIVSKGVYSDAARE